MFALKNLCSFIRAAQCHSGKNLDKSTYSHKKIEKGDAPFLYHIGFSRNEESMKPEGHVPGPGGFGTSRDRKMYFSLVSPLYRDPDPKHKPLIHLLNQHDLLSVLDLEATQTLLEFYQTADGSVLCYDTVPSECLPKIINIKDGSERIGKAQSK